MHLVRLGLQPGEESPHTVPNVLGPFAFAVEHPGALRSGQLAPRRVDGNAALARELDEVGLALLVRVGLPRFDRPLAQRERLVGNDQSVVDSDDAAEAAAGVAGAYGGVEAEGARARVLVSDVAVGAMEPCGEAPGCGGDAGVIL